jgi:hypothetical protein
MATFDGSSWRLGLSNSTSTAMSSFERRDYCEIFQCNDRLVVNGVLREERYILGLAAGSSSE